MKKKQHKKGSPTLQTRQESKAPILSKEKISTWLIIALASIFLTLSVAPPIIRKAAEIMAPKVETTNHLLMITHIILFCISYLFFFSFALFSLYGIITIIKNNKNKVIVLTKHVATPFCFISIFFVFFIFCLIVYNKNSFLSYGDQIWYWVSGQAFIKDGFFSFKNYALIETCTFRGYLYPLIILLIRLLSFENETVSHILYFIVASLITSAFLTIIIPKLYTQLCGKKANYIQIYIFSFVYFIFWRYYTFYPLAELFAITALFLSFFLFFKYWQTQQKTYALFTGVALSAAVSFRQPFQIFANLCLVVLFVFIFIQVLAHILQKNNLKISPNVINLVNKRHIYLVLLGFIVVCMPQIIINFHRGHLGIFAYDFSGAVASVSSLQTLAQASVAIGFSFFLGHPYVLNNPVGGKIIFDAYQNIDPYTLQTLDFIYIVITHPLEFLSMALIRLFLLLDIKFPDEYPLVAPEILFKPNLFSIFNYFIWATSICTVWFKNIRQKLYNKKEILLFAIVFIFFGAIQTLVHGEWRYVLPLYISAYYYFGYKLMGGLTSRQGDNIAKDIPVSFFVAIACIMAVMTSLSNVFYAAFV